MSFLADYHGPRTRSRALGIHQTSVYLGTAGGAALAGFLAERQGWRSPFWVLGLVGIVYAVFLSFGLVEPVRSQAADDKDKKRDLLDDEDWARLGRERESLGEQVAADHRQSRGRDAAWLCLWARTSWRRRF